MTVPITFDARDALAARDRADAAKRRRVRSVSAVLAIALGAVIAVPAPIERAREVLAAEAVSLGQRVDAADAQADELAALTAECAVAEDADQLIARWFGAVPRDDVTWLVELVAERCGVRVLGLDVSSIGDPLERDASDGPREPSRVLGVQVAAADDVDPDVSISFDDEDADDALEPAALVATRWTLDGRGDMASIVTLAGLLGASDAPLRLREVVVVDDGDGQRVRLVADRLALADGGGDA